ALPIFLELSEWQLVSTDPLHRKPARFDHSDSGRPAIRAQVSTAYVQLLVVADDRPVDAHFAAEDAVLDIGAQLAQDVQALADGGRMSGPLEIDISPVAVGHVLDLRHRVLLANVDDHICAAVLGEIELVLSHV